MSRIVDKLRSLLDKASKLPWKADIDDRDTEKAVWTGKIYVGPDQSDTWVMWANDSQCINNLILVETMVNLLPEILRQLDEQEKKLSSIFNTLVE